MIRSYLFVPAHEARLVRRAHERGADAVLLDLEDSVPAAQKQAARAALPDAVAHLAGHGVIVLVRINAGLGDCVRDIEVACRDGVQALVLSKVSGADHIRAVGRYMSECERVAGLSEGAIGLVGLIETADALLKAREIAGASARVTAVALGGEDFSTHCGFLPTAETLTHPCQQLVFAARAAGVQAIGVPGSVADIRDIDSFDDAARLARRLGMDAVLCVHPRQVEVVNAAFRPSAEELVEAERILSAFEEAEREGHGAIQLDGRMIDPPVVDRARAMLRRSPPRRSHA